MVSEKIETKENLKKKIYLFLMFWFPRKWKIFPNEILGKNLFSPFS